MPADRAGRACPVCGTRDLIPARFALVSCVDCGAVVNERVWDLGADEELEAAWFDGESNEPQPSAWVRMFDRWNARLTWRRLRRAGVSSGRALEIGPGRGSTIALLAEHGLRAEGCDVSRVVCRYVTQTYGIPMHDRPVADIPGDGVFDVIVMNHMLEHVSDPVGLLRQIRRLLRPGGTLHIAVPNVASWEARLSGWTSYQPYHLIYFGPTTLRMTLGRAGLTTRTVDTREPFSGWFLALLRTALGRNAESVARADTKRSAWTEALYRSTMLAVGGLLFPFRALQSALLAGEELVVIATRDAD